MLGIKSGQLRGGKGYDLRIYRDQGFIRGARRKVREAFECRHNRFSIIELVAEEGRQNFNCAAE
jgi:hypothetical protein